MNSIDEQSSWAVARAHFDKSRQALDAAQQESAASREVVGLLTAPEVHGPAGRWEQALAAGCSGLGVTVAGAMVTATWLLPSLAGCLAAIGVAIAEEAYRRRVPGGFLTRGHRFTVPLVGGLVAWLFLRSLAATTEGLVPTQLDSFAAWAAAALVAATLAIRAAQFHAAALQLDRLTEAQRRLAEANASVAAHERDVERWRVQLDQASAAGRRAWIDARYQARSASNFSQDRQPNGQVAVAEA